MYPYSCKAACVVDAGVTLFFSTTPHSLAWFVAQRTTVACVIAQGVTLHCIALVLCSMPVVGVPASRTPLWWMEVQVDPMEARGHDR